MCVALPSDFQKYIHTSRYARYLDDKGRRETWEETVDRYVGFFVDRGLLHGDQGLDEIEAAIKNLDVMPSMRCMMTAGDALDIDHVAGYNCAYLAVDSPRAFDEAMYILLCGTGVGFSVERQYINELSIIAEDFHDTETVINVRDSKLGWAKAFREFISLLYSGQVPKWDVSKVRPAGSRLKTFGGRASGPDPLIDLFKFSIGLFKGAAGRKLNSLECHDLMCKVADIVVVGGVRRSALISLSNLTDDRMRKAKNGQWWVENPQRALSNNSVCYTEKPDVMAFMTEFRNLYESKSGERGIFNRVAAKKTVEKIGRRDPDHDFGVNPCCFTGDMRLLVNRGGNRRFYETFESLEGKDVNIVSYDGSISNGTVWCSGQKPTVEVRFAGEQDSITCTDDHVFMLTDGKECKAKDLKGNRVMPFFDMKNTFTHGGGDAFLAGYIQGDGACSRLDSKRHKGLEVWFGEKDGDIAEMYCQEVGRWYSREARDIAIKYELHPDVLPERTLPEWVANFRVDFGAEPFDFLAGMYSANGCVIKGHRVSYKTTCKKLASELVSVLDRIGITAYITTNKAKKVSFKNGDYVCKESYDVNISRYKDVLLFAEKISFGQKYKQKALRDLILHKAPFVTAINDFGVHKIYDFTEPKNNWGIVEGCVVHNSEIILRSKQFCNLSEVVVRRDDTFDDLKRKVRIAAILGTLQSTLTDFRYVSKKWRKNTEEERLLGVSLTGIMDHPVLSGNVYDGGFTDPIHAGKLTLSMVLRELKDVAIETNIEWANLLGINPSTAITCVKPSGTVSQLVDSSSGIHPRYSRYYIRTVRTDKKDPLYTFLKDQGVPVEDAIGKETNTAVFSFPMKAPEGSVMRDDMTALEQLDLWKIYAEHWCEHKPSITVYVREEEWFDVQAWVWKNFDICSGISFLPHTDHVYKQAPYQEIDEETYNKMVEEMPQIDWEAFKEDDDNTIGSQEYACTGGACEIV